MPHPVCPSASHTPSPRSFLPRPREVGPTDCPTPWEVGPTGFPSHLEVGPITVPPTERWGLRLPQGLGRDPRLQDWERTQLPLVRCLPKCLLSCHLPRPLGGPPPPARPPPGSCARHTGMVSEGHQPPSDHSPSRAVRMATIRRWAQKPSLGSCHQRVHRGSPLQNPAPVITPRPLHRAGQKPGPGPPPAPSAPGWSPLQGLHCPLGTQPAGVDGEPPQSLTGP